MSTFPEALLRQTEDLPFITFDASFPFVDEGRFSLQLMQVDAPAGLWIIRTRFAPGTTVQKHRHTGPIFAFTYSGSWSYREYPNDVNVAGSYLYEPAGSVHTLHAPKSNREDTDVCFVMNGANLNIGKDGNVESVLDAATALDLYLSMCAAQGLPKPKVIGA